MASRSVLSALGMAAPSRAQKSRTLPSTPRSTYRVLLQSLQHIPDPHVWATVVPHFRETLVTAHTPLPEATGSESQAESSKMAMARLHKERAAKRVKNELNKIRAAAACHPHALVRLIEECYGQRGRVKWDLIKNVTLSAPVAAELWPEQVRAKDAAPRTRYPPTEHQPVPLPLQPLSKTYPTGGAKVVRARTTVPPSAIRREAYKRWSWAWKDLTVPLIIPPNDLGARTGWEDKGVVETFRTMAGLEDDEPVHPPLPRRQRTGPPPERKSPVALPTYLSLPPSLRAVFPRRSWRKYRRPEFYPRPRASLTRENPNTWGNPRPLTPRLLRRTYRRVWDSLPWVGYKPTARDRDGGDAGGVWKCVDYGFIDPGAAPRGPQVWREATTRWTAATPTDVEWVTELEERK